MQTTSKRKIFYFPGLNSGKDSRKFQIIKDFFGEKYEYVLVDWQEHHHIPALLNTIKREKGYDYYLIVGDSTGANFAYQFRDLLDPSRETHLLLLSPLLSYSSIKADVNFPEDTRVHLKEIHPSHCTIIYGENDEVLNFENSLSTLQDSSVNILKVDDSHRLMNLQEYLPFAKERFDKLDVYYQRYYTYRYSVVSAFIGLAVGDALGVPVEFEDREYLKSHPVKSMKEGGTHGQKAGTFSDDTSLAFCLAENLIHGYSVDGIAENFVKWYDDGFWSARGEVFDIGIATREALEKIKAGVQPLAAGSTAENSNGNGSLMRILPLLFYVCEMPLQDRFRITKEVSSITHAHIRSVICCFYYLEFARLIFKGKILTKAFHILRTEFPQNLQELGVPLEEISKLSRLFQEDFGDLPEEEIHSSGYVVHTLEASIWCLLNSDGYNEAVFKAVNLGDDTDTTGCVTGGLAGLAFGFYDISPRWLRHLARRYDIQKLARKITDKFFV